MKSGDIRPTWREELLWLWEDFTGVSGGKAARPWRAVVCILLVLGTSFAVLSYLRLRGEPRAFVPSLNSTAMDVDRARLEALVSEMREMMSQRANSAAWVQSMRARKREIFEPLTVPGLQADMSAEPPPEIVVRAVMRTGKSWIAVVDIAGAGSGLVVHPGDSFMDGRGQVVRIDSGGIVVRWDGREWNAVPGLF